MRNDIVGQLRDTRYPGQLGMRLQAADEIERLRAALRVSGNFDPTNHHNATLCPYCTPAASTSSKNSPSR